MRCPACNHKMRKVVPLIFQGEGVDTYACVSENCHTTLNHKPSVFSKEVEFQVMVTVKTAQADTGLDTAALQEDFIKDVFLTYQAATPGDCRKFSVAVCTD